MSDLTQLVPWWLWVLLIVSLALLLVVGRCRSVSLSRRRSVLAVVQGTARAPRPDDDAAVQRIHVLRWPGHVWVVVPLDLATGIVTHAVDAGDAADRIADIYRGRSDGDLTRYSLLGDALWLHVRRGGRR